MPYNGAVEKLGKAARSGFKTPKAKSFGEAREGALKQMAMGKAPAESEVQMPKSVSPREKDESDRLQEISDRGGGLTLEQSKEALSRRKKKAPKEVYDSKE